MTRQGRPVGLIIAAVAVLAAGLLLLLIMKSGDDDTTAGASRPPPGGSGGATATPDRARPNPDRPNAPQVSSVEREPKHPERAADRRIGQCAYLVAPTVPRPTSHRKNQRFDIRRSKLVESYRTQRGDL